MAISYLYVSKPNKLFQYVNMINIVFAREFFFRNGFQVQMFFNSKCLIASYRTFEIAWKMFLNAYLGDNACFFIILTKLFVEQVIQRSLECCQPELQTSQYE